ncbi:MAG: outer membrane beta-barrel protein [Acidobacteria bacterium]|nr:outer membrane beta-barrel protein [Acidobacteriota bacterium]
MRQRLVFCLIAAALLALPTPGAAQHREPHAGSFAIGGDVGIYVPGTEFHAGFNPDIYAEIYALKWMSFRVMGAGASPKFDTDTEELRQARGTFNVLFNWEAELWHPFVTFGGGAYYVQARAAGVNVGPARTKGGGNFGAGIEYFARPKVTFKFEATYHYVPQGDLLGDPSGLALTMGLKKYF